MKQGDERQYDRTTEQQGFACPDPHLSVRRGLSMPDDKRPDPETQVSSFELPVSPPVNPVILSSTQVSSFELPVSPPVNPVILSSTQVSNFQFPISSIKFPLPSSRPTTEMRLKARSFVSKAMAARDCRQGRAALGPRGFRLAHGAERKLRAPRLCMRACGAPGDREASAWLRANLSKQM
jgi:hypothetical protein